MAAQNTSRQPSQQTDYIDIKDLFYLCLAKWHWFVIAILIAMALAMLYLLTTPPTFKRSASLMIKEDSKSQSISSDISSMFSGLGISQSASNVNNELVVIESPASMLETVKRLSLDVSYTVRGAFHKESLYGTSLPIKVSFDDLADNESAKLKVSVKEDSTLLLTEFVKSSGKDKVKDWTKVSARIGDAVETPIGRLTIMAGAGYQPHIEAGAPDITVTRTDIYSMTEAVKSNFSATVNGEKNTVIDITYKDIVPQRAEDMLNTLITVYKENWMRDKNEMVRSTSMFINDRLSVIERELGDVDEDISAYKSEHLLPDVEMAADLYMTQSKENESRMLEINTRLSMAHYIRSYLAGGAGEGQLLPVNSGMESTSIEAQISEYNALQLERNSLVANSSERNPLVVTRDASLRSMRQAILTSIDNYIVTLDTQLSDLQKSERQTNSQISSKPDQAKYLSSIGRQQKVKETLYLFLLQKREENELSQAFTAYNTRMITPPSGSLRPFSPNGRNVLLVALMLGLLVPLVVVFLRENMDTTIRGRKDLKNVTVPFLGEVPQTGDGSHRKLKGVIKRKEKQNRVVVVREGCRDVVNEAFRVLRTNLEFMAGTDSMGNVIAVTSFNPGSGKSFLSMNMAMSLAIRKKKVLVIDGDLRHGSASEYVGSPRVGLSDFLRGKASNPQDIIVTSGDCDTLDVLPIGTIPPNPTELLYDDRLAKLTDTVRGLYDYVLIDCPPVELVADAQILDKYADMTIFVVRAGLLERSMLPELQSLYDEKKYKNMALVLNGTEGAGGRYGYRYGYKYGYHYGYGYGYASKS